MITAEIVTYPYDRQTRYETFDERLRKVMAERGMTGESLSAKIRMDRSNLSRIKRGVHKPDFWTLCEIAQALNISIDWLVGFTDEMRPLKPEN